MVCDRRLHVRPAEKTGRQRLCDALAVIHYPVPANNKHFLLNSAVGTIWVVERTIPVQRISLKSENGAEESSLSPIPNPIFCLSDTSKRVRWVRPRSHRRSIKKGAGMFPRPRL